MQSREAKSVAKMPTKASLSMSDQCRETASAIILVVLVMLLCRQFRDVVKALQKGIVLMCKRS